MIKSFSIMLALAASLPAVAMAADDNIAVSATAGKTYAHTVVADDLDLTRGAGQATLRTRIAYAVRQVCGTSGAHRRPLLPSEEACVANSAANADRQAQAMIASATRQASAAAVHSAN